MYKLKLNNKITEDYSCPLTNITMNKSCPITNCHANVHACHPTGCLYQIYGGKHEFDKFDLMYCLNVNDKIFKTKFDIGKQHVHEVAILLNILNRLRDNPNRHHCHHCGVLRTSRGDCINKIECDNRLKLAKHILKHSRLSYPEFKASKEDVYLLLYNKAKLEEFVVSNDWELQWFELLGFSESLVEKTNLIRCCV